MEAIKAEELRIGNWYFDGENYAQVTGIHGGKIYNKYGWGLISNDYPLAIPLTKEVLEKAGFVRHYVGDKENQVFYIWELGEFSLPVDDEGTVYFDSEFSVSNSITNLHQLQNLYFAILGEDLEITL